MVNHNDEVKFNDGTELCFVPETVKKELRIYLNSESFDNTKCVYGTKAIQSYVKFLMNSTPETENQAIPMTQLFNLKERAKVMQLRFEYMSKNGYLPKENDYVVRCNEVTQHYTKALNIWIKYHMTRIPELKTTVCGEILRALDVEISTLEQVIVDIE